MANLKGYIVQKGYMGILRDGTKMLFPTEDEYVEYMEEEEANMAKHISYSDVAIYLYVARVNSLVVLEEDLKDYWEAVDHCGIYYKNNKVSEGNNLLFYSYGKWFVYDPIDKIGVEAA